MQSESLIKELCIMNAVNSNAIDNAKENLNYISNLKKIGKRVYDNIYGKVENVSIYRVITNEKGNRAIGYEKSNAIGKLDLCSVESRYQLCVSFPQVPFIPNHALKDKTSKYPREWEMNDYMQMHFPFRYKSLSVSHPRYSESTRATCEIYDCKTVYLVILESVDSEKLSKKLYFVMRKY